jgi:hypothetical protein
MNTDGTNGHLSAKDISRWLVEGPTAEAEGHVESCWSCQGKLAEAREPLTAFRAAVVAWSEKQPAPSIMVGNENKGLRGRSLFDWMPTASVAFALLVLAVFTVERGPWLIHPEAQNARNTPPVSDTVLMEQVDEEVSEAVPDAMAPLTDLVAWDSNSAAASEAATTKHVMKKKPAAGVHSKSHGHEPD